MLEIGIVPDRSNVISFAERYRNAYGVPPLSEISSRHVLFTGIPSANTLRGFLEKGIIESGDQAYSHVTYFIPFGSQSDFANNLRAFAEVLRFRGLAEGTGKTRRQNNIKLPWFARIRASDPQLHGLPSVRSYFSLREGSATGIWKVVFTVEPNKPSSHKGEIISMVGRRAVE